MGPAVVLEFGAQTTRIGDAGEMLPALRLKTETLMPAGKVVQGDFLDQGVFQDWRCVEATLHSLFERECTSRVQTRDTPDKTSAEASIGADDGNRNGIDGNKSTKEAEDRNPAKLTPPAPAHSEGEGMKQASLADAGRVRQGAPLLIVDSPANPDSMRERMCELLFEQGRVSGLYAMNSLVASVYSAGRVSSYVFDVGHDSTHAGVVHEGFLFPHTYECLPVGGKAIARHFQVLLDERGTTLTSTTAEQAMHMHARVAADFAKEASDMILTPQAAQGFTLPDGRTLGPLGDTGLRCAETLFQPALVEGPARGLSDVLADMTALCISDSKTPALRNIPLFYLGVGGTSQMPGMAERLEKDLIASTSALSGTASSALSRGLYVSCVSGSAPDRHHAAWVGGSIVASLPHFVDNMFISKEDYDEDGSQIILKRC